MDGGPLMFGGGCGVYAWRWSQFSARYRYRGFAVLFFFSPSPLSRPAGLDSRVNRWAKYVGNRILRALKSGGEQAPSSAFSVPMSSAWPARLQCSGAKVRGVSATWLKSSNDGASQRVNSLPFARCGQLPALESGAAAADGAPHWQSQTRGSARARCLVTVPIGSQVKPRRHVQRFHSESGCVYEN